MALSLKLLQGYLPNLSGVSPYTHYLPEERGDSHTSTMSISAMCKEASLEGLGEFLIFVAQLQIMVLLLLLLLFS